MSNDDQSKKSSEQYASSEEMWRGPCYELSIMLGRSSDVRLEAAWRTLRQHPTFEVWSNDMDEAWYIDMIPKALRPTERSTEGAYGVARLPNGDRAACTGGSLTLDREHGYDEPHDELALCIRQYSLPASTPVEMIYAWLADIGRFVFSRVPHEWAMIGDELDSVDAPQSLDSFRDSERRFGLLVPSDNGLLWYPPNTDLWRF